MPKTERNEESTHRSAEALVNAGLVRADAARAAAAVAARYAVAVTPSIDAMIDRNDPEDPVARQFIPSAHELDDAEGEMADPISDGAFGPVEGIVHRYRDRVLLMPVHTCATYCRYCFRRARVGNAAAPLSAPALDRALAYIRDRPEVWEVILSGGDPFVLSPRRVAEIVGALDAIDHVGVIRIHTRVPVADPARITDNLVQALDADKAVYVIVHCNHARELTPDAIGATRRLIAAGIPVLSQSVLLRGVNDDAATLETLFRTLVRARIKPYYLHHPDRAPGTGHFQVSLAEGRRLVDLLRGPVSGLCQPTYVLDVPGGHGKIPAAPTRIEDAGGGTYVLRDPQDDCHAYRDAPTGHRLPATGQADRFRARNPRATSPE